MVTALFFALFGISCIALSFAGEWLVRSLSRISALLRWSEFTVSFFLMSFATSLPELFVGITSAAKGIPELSFGNIIGQNIIHYTIAIALCSFILGSLDARNRTVRAATNFTLLISLAPLLLIVDGTLSRADGAALIIAFIAYASWLFSRKEYFGKEYVHHEQLPGEFFAKARLFFFSAGGFTIGAALLLGSAFGIISSAMHFSDVLNIPIAVVGALIVGLGTALPETYFSIASARKGNSWMLVGNLMGSTAISASIVLGVVAMIRPIVIESLDIYLVSRIFLFASALMFWAFFRSGRRITSLEGIFLAVIYAAFIFVQISINSAA